MDEYFAGIRGTLPVSFSYRLTGGITNMYQLPLFLNIPKTSLFTVLHEERIQTFHLKASAEWLPSDKISADMGLDLYQILKQKEEKKAWHFIPMQFNVGARWKPTGDLTLQTKMYIWDGPYVKIDDQSNSRKLPAVFDASIEADFRISKLFLLWLQMNNIFNQQYQRWNQYPVVGFQLIGGIRLNFEQKK
jgi:outer membrane receptor for ferrienterochelin and colicin